TLGFIGDAIAAFARKNAPGVVAVARQLALRHGKISLRLLLRGPSLPPAFMAQIEEARRAGLAIDLIQ
ncbi:hypothetical protein, partial [Escherichia coli]|uniref:hypothetical protein n=1 Tax=Escherichia coli TaxID=562 RepID=UPI001953712B